MSHTLIDASRTLSTEVSRLAFKNPVTHVYNPLEYAREPYERYLERFATGAKRVVFVGMNPGPWGMAQTGVPFGEIETVSGWMGIRGSVEKPTREHPKRPIEGFACTRSEVSGRRLWGLMAARFETAQQFFSDHFVANYCPLVFMEKSGRNRTPDKLPAAEREPLFRACDAALAAFIAALSPAWVIGIGKFAESRVRRVIESMDFSPPPQTASVLHPSPASPAANRGWEEAALKRMKELGVW